MTELTIKIVILYDTGKETSYILRGNDIGKKLEDKLYYMDEYFIPEGIYVGRDVWLKWNECVPTEKNKSNPFVPRIKGNIYITKLNEDGDMVDLTKEDYLYAKSRLRDVNDTLDRHYLYVKEMRDKLYPN